MQKYIKFLLLVLVIAILVPQITLAAWWNPMSWGVWNRIFHSQKQQEKLIGGDKDSHGCLIAAGYSWCEVKNKCLRVWEEKCEVSDNYFEVKEVGLKFKITDDIGDLVYKIENKGAIKNVYFSSKSLAFDDGCNFNPSDKGPLGVLTISNKSLATPDGYWAYNNPIYKSNNLYVYYITPQSVCSDKSSIMELQTKQLNLLKEAIKTITEISVDQTANWKTYTNSQYGFEIKYPTGSRITDSDITGGRIISIQLPVSGNNNLVNKDLRISIVNQQYGKNDNGSVIFVPANCGPDTFYNYETSDVVINGINFRKGDVSGAFGGMQSASSAIQYCVMKGDKSFRLISVLTYQRDSKLSTVNINDEAEVLNQIISTFKFIK